MHTDKNPSWSTSNGFKYPTCLRYAQNGRPPLYRGSDAGSFWMFCRREGYLEQHLAIVHLPDSRRAVRGRGGNECVAWRLDDNDRTRIKIAPSE